MDIPASNSNLSNILEGVHIWIANDPTVCQLESDNFSIQTLVEQMGGRVDKDLDMERLTHIICTSYAFKTPSIELKLLIKMFKKKAYIIKKHWVFKCHNERTRVDERDFIHDKILYPFVKAYQNRKLHQQRQKNRKNETKDNTKLAVEQFDKGRKLSETEILSSESNHKSSSTQDYSISPKDQERLVETCNVLREEIQRMDMEAATSGESNLINLIKQDDTTAYADQSDRKHTQNTEHSNKTTPRSAALDRNPTNPFPNSTSVPSDFPLPNQIPTPTPTPIPKPTPNRTTAIQTWNTHIAKLTPTPDKHHLFSQIGSSPSALFTWSIRLVCIDISINHNTVVNIRMYESDAQPATYAVYMDCGGAVRGGYPLGGNGGDSGQREGGGGGGGGEGGGEEGGSGPGQRRLLHTLYRNSWRDGDYNSAGRRLGVVVAPVGSSWEVAFAAWRAEFKRLTACEWEDRKRARLQEWPHELRESMVRRGMKKPFKYVDRDGDINLNLGDR